MKAIISITVFIIFWSIVYLLTKKIRNQHIRIIGDLDKCISPRKKALEVEKKLNLHTNAKGILSISLFGNTKKEGFRKRYIDPILYNTKKINSILPGWAIRIYLSPEITEDIIQELIDNNCEVFIMKNKPIGYEGTTWRFLAASGDKPFLSFDSDDKIDDPTLGNLRKGVENWLKSKKPFFRRSLYHINFLIPLSAGTWGAKPGSIKNIEEKLEKYCSEKQFGMDEAFLTKEIWPLLLKNGYHHTYNRIEISIYVFIIIFLIIISIYIFQIINYQYTRLKNPENP